jgi:hypothetical protein
MHTHKHTQERGLLLVHMRTHTYIHTQERGQLLRAEDKRLSALASELASQKQVVAETEAARLKAHQEAVAAQQRR